MTAPGRTPFEEEMQAVWCELFLPGSAGARITPVNSDLRRIVEHWRSMEGEDYGTKLVAHLQLLRDELPGIAEEFNGFGAQRMAGADHAWRERSMEDIQKAQAAGTQYVRDALLQEASQKIHSYFEVRKHV